MQHYPGVIAGRSGEIVATIQQHVQITSYYQPMALHQPNFFSCKLSVGFHSESCIVYTVDSEEVLKEKETIFDGVGLPDLQLTLYLLLTWSIIALIVIRGVKSTGKAAYFLGNSSGVDEMRSCN